MIARDLSRQVDSDLGECEEPDVEINTPDGTKVARRPTGFIIKLSRDRLATVGTQWTRGNIERATREKHESAIVLVYIGDVACNVH